MQTLLSSFSSIIPSSFLLYPFLIACVGIGLYFLIKGGDLLCDHCSDLATYFGIPRVVIGLTVVSIATSAPELFTSIAAIRSNSNGLILGNIIGSNIANICLILGLAAMVKPIKSKGEVPFSQVIVLSVITLYFCTTLYFPESGLNIGSAISLLVFIGLYLVFLTSRAIKTNIQPSNEDEAIEVKNPTISIIFIFLSTGLLWLGSDILVFGSKNLATSIGIPEELIGFTLIAIGTSLPELATSLVLVKKEEHAMLLGNVIGSNLFNIGLVGGIAGLFGAVTTSVPFPWIDYAFLLLSTLLLVIFLRKQQINRNCGIAFLLTYITASLTTWIFNGGIN